MLVTGIVFPVLILDACKKKEVATTTPLQFIIPQGWPQPTSYFVNDPLNEETFQLGRKLFYEGKLSKDGNFPWACHLEPLFTDNSYRNIGLPIDPTLKDYGRMRVTGDKNDSLKFLVPSLRNVMLTSYYAHDGRFSDVGQMLLHYISGIQKNSTPDPLLINGIPLTATEMSYLISFMSALTDDSINTNPRFLKP